MFKTKMLGFLGAAFLGLGLFAPAAEAGHRYRYSTCYAPRVTYPAYHVRPVYTSYYSPRYYHAPVYRPHYYPVVRRHYQPYPTHYRSYYPNRAFSLGYGGRHGHFSFGYAD